MSFPVKPTLCYITCLYLLHITMLDAMVEGGYYFLASTIAGNYRSKFILMDYTPTISCN